jgi:copper transport protein
MRRRLCSAALFLIGVTALVIGAGSPAGAHNTLTGSDPAPGEVRSAAPPQLTLRFANPVPLETLTVQLIDASGARTALSGFDHGAAGATEVVAPLPPLTGDVTLRWRLVGPDGHPITDRIEFHVSVPGVGTDAGAGSPGGSVEAPAPRAADLGAPWSTPSPVRWVLRWLSYVAMVGLGGLLGAAAWLVPGTWDHPQIRRWVAGALGGVGLLALLQLTVVTSDIRGAPLWGSLGALPAAVGTDAGVALVVRVVAVLVMAAVLLRAGGPRPVPWVGVGLLFAFLLATWAYGGHSRSMRWPLLGVPVDVAHHAAAAIWLGGLVTVSRLGLGERRADEVVTCVQRFARLAMVAVGVLVATGVVQTLRLTGSPAALWSASHGRFLLFKLVLLGVLLKVADINRGRVARRFRHPGQVTPGAVWALRRAMGTEFVVGLAIIGVTAALVVAPPAVADALVALAGDLPR